MESEVEKPEIVAPPEYDVIVVGFGPAGVVATCWLGQARLHTFTIDKSRTIWDIPRAIALDHEIMRLFQNLGIAQQVLKYTAPFPDAKYLGAEGQLIRRVDIAPPPYPMGYVPNMVFTQPAVEEILRESAAEPPNVKISLGLEAVSIEQSHDHVTLKVRDEEGRTRRVTASYLIACDGASSFIRRSLGIPLDDLSFDEPWMVIDARLNEKGLAKLPAVVTHYCDPARPATLIIGPGNHRRWEIMLSPGEDPKFMERKENVWGLLSRWITPADGELWRASSYRFHALVAKEWRRDRVFIAGDAAHQQPPFFGQGMCQGIRDVTNLSWKLHSVLSGEADESLLDSYQEERSLHVRTLITRIIAVGRDICERDPEKARLRDELLIKQGGGQASVSIRHDVMPPLSAGLISDVQHPANGNLFPQPFFITADGPQLIDDLIGSGWRLILDGRRLLKKDQNSFEMKTVIIGGEGLQEKDGVVAAWFDRYDCMGAIVRPDHYVYGAITAIEEAIPMLKSLQSRLLQNPIRRVCTVSSSARTSL